MFVPRSDLQANTYDFETEALIKPTGFREYDARWWFGREGHARAPEINLLGIQALGLGLGTLIHQLGRQAKIVVGHDYRSYSISIKQALTVGLMSAGIEVHDIGLALSPTAYFAQFDLGIECVAMVTASHNENGWTGVKMGVEPPLTFGPKEMGQLKDIVLSGKGVARAGGGYVRETGVRERYIADLVAGNKIKRPLKVVAACGNGTAGAFVIDALQAVGVEVIPMDCQLDHSFPHYNPNPEDMKMLHAMAAKVKETGADLALGFDGDGDRCGVVDNTGEEIFADKVGVMLARDLSGQFANAKFVADVKSTGIYAMDPVLIANGASTDYWKTGHSYIKRRTTELGAVAGFEKSGHYFFRPPIGRGYDCGLVTAIAILAMLDRNPEQSMAYLKNQLPQTWLSPSMSPACADEEKYAVVEKIVAQVEADFAAGKPVIEQQLTSVVTVNGVRFTVKDGTWGLIRASSNTPNLVVVVESPVSKQNMLAMFHHIEGILAQYPQIGAFDQKL
ncbi:Phosphoglucosamine mutase / Phosphomannomutase [hydrothermal vent metagenome]|uniref:Phosphoglucosamine mutase / Phosphomannomutase n=1 Tax=hydrothermal vent metagenome TaxID=652676 RepID=A0A3B0RH94_9ZZZZ